LIGTIALEIIFLLVNFNLIAEILQVCGSQGACPSDQRQQVQDHLLEIPHRAAPGRKSNAGDSRTSFSDKRIMINNDGIHLLMCFS
jgi:hypothetical protein